MNTQCNKMLKIILDNPQVKYWYAKDFQSGKWFIGYEATARMSDLLRMYSDILIPIKDGRFRAIYVNWGKEKEIQDLKEYLKTLEEISNAEVYSNR